MNNFLKSSPNIIILMMSITILVNSVRAYNKKENKLLLIYLIIATTYKYILSIFTFI